MQVGTNHLGHFVPVNRTSRRRTKTFKVSSWVVPAAILWYLTKGPMLHKIGNCKN